LLLVLAVASPAAAEKAHFGGGGQIILDGVIDVDCEIRRPSRRVTPTKVADFGVRSVIGGWF
jgi:hypothetical protein